MATLFDLKTRKQLSGGIAGDVKNTFPALLCESAGNDGFDLANGLAGGLFEAMAHLAKAADEAFPQTASFAALKKHASPFIGDPLAATEATGAIILSGTPGSTWSIGDTLIHRTTLQRYQTTTAGTVPPAGTASANIEALVGGDAGRLVDGELLYFESPPAGISAEATVDGDMEGGTEAEAYENYLARYLDFVQTPAAGGTAEDFRTWALSVEGVGIASSHPNRRDYGTCDVAVLDFEGDLVSAAVLAAVQVFIDLMRPCCSYDSLAIHPILTDVDLTFNLVLRAPYLFSVFTATLISGALSTKTEIHVLDALGATPIAVGDWLAIPALNQARQVVSLDTSGAPHKVTVAAPFSTEPLDTWPVIPGGPTYDALAAAIVALFVSILPGSPYYQDVGEAALNQNPEVTSANQTAPGGDVAAIVDPTKVEALRLNSLTLTNV